MNKFGMLLGAAVAVAIGGTAIAQTGGMRYRATYYSNAQHTEVVGYVITWCDNTVTGNGELTQYYEDEWFDC